MKDAGDLPLQLKRLAEAVDDDVAALQATASAALNPPSASISALVTTFDLSTNRFLFDTVDFDNAGMANLVIDALIAPTPGLYMIVGGRSYSASAPTGTQLNVAVNGLIIETSSINPNAAADVNRNNVSTTTILAAGDTVTMGGSEPSLSLDGPGFLQMFMAVAL